MENKEYIIGVIQKEFTEKHAEDMFGELPIEVQKSIDLMVTKLTKMGKEESLIALFVKNDVSNGLSGCAHSMLNSFRYLHPETIGTL